MKKVGLVLLCSLLLICGCSQTEVELPYSGTEEHVEVGISLSLPHYGLPTRSAISGISRIDVLVFEYGGYAYTSRGRIVSESNNGCSFRFLLRKTDAAVTLWFIANPGGSLTDAIPAAGDTPDQAKKKINRTFTTSGMISDFPMWGECTLPSGIDENTTITERIKLLRAVSRIDINATQVASDFELLSVQAFRANNLIQVVPDAVQTDQQGKTRVVSASVPEASSADVSTPVYAAPQGNIADGLLFVPESLSEQLGRQSTCIVIGGYHKTDRSKPTYYRIDIGKSGKKGELLRNTRYKVSVTSVGDPGHEDPQEAAMMPAALIETEVLEWNEQDSYVAYNGQYYLSITSRVAELRGEVGSQRTLEIHTDIPEGYTLQRCNRDGVPTSQLGEPLGDHYFEVVDNHGSITITARLENPKDSPNREAFLLLKAGVLEMMVTIVQLPAETPSGGKLKMINVLSFQSVNQDCKGHLGTNWGSRVAPSEYSNGLRAIIDNPDNFGTDGIVKCGGHFLIMETSRSLAALTQKDLDFFNVIFLNLHWDSYLTSAAAEIISKWLMADENRALFIIFDNNTNQAVLDQFGTSVRYNTFWYPSIHRYLDIAPSQGSYFLNEGPFGAVDPSLRIRFHDVHAGSIKSSTGTIMPILTESYSTTGGASSNVVVGADLERRIMYIGDGGIFSATNNVAEVPDYPSESFIDDTSGVVDTDAERLVANIWAWAVEVVTGS